MTRIMATRVVAVITSIAIMQNCRDYRDEVAHGNEDDDDEDNEDDDACDDGDDDDVNYGDDGGVMMMVVFLLALWMVMMCRFRCQVGTVMGTLVVVVACVPWVAMRVEARRVLCLRWST